MASFESYGTVSCWHSIATIAVSLAISELLSVKLWHGLGVVQGSWKWRRSIYTTGLLL